MKQKEYIPALGYVRLSNFYDRAIRWTMPEKKFRDILVNEVNPTEGEHILEFGYGTGSQTILLKERCPKASITGVDIDPKIRKIALAKTKDKNLEISYDLYDGVTLPYSDSSFDKVVSCLVFHQLDQTQKMNALLKLIRVLIPGGQIYIADWGKAKNPGMRLAFLAVQFLDGFKTTTDNVRGLLPIYMESAGFSQVEENAYMNTAIGSFSFYRAEKSL